LLFYLPVYYDDIISLYIMDITKIAPEEEGSEGTGEKEEVHALQPNEAV
jgi:hypothetical protein